MPVIPTLWEAKTGGSLEARSLRPAWATQQDPVSTKKKKKISQAWWRVLVVPATWEAEAKVLLEPRRWRLQWAVFMHCTPTWATEQDPIPTNKQIKILSPSLTEGPPLGQGDPRKKL